MGDTRTTSGQKPLETATARKSKLRRILRTFLLSLTLIGLGGHFIKLPKYAYANGYATTINYAEVRSPIEGRVAEILHTSGDAVKAGDILLRLEDKTEKSDYEEALSKVSEGEAQLAFRESEAADALKQHNNAVHAAEMELEQTRKNLELTQQLFQKSLASGRQLSTDEFAVRRSEETLRSLKEIDMSVAQKQLLVLRQNVVSLREAATRAKVAMEKRTVKAPIDGHIVRYTFYPGELIRPDMVLYEVFDGDVNTMKLRVPERYAAQVKVGQRVEARLGTHKTIIPKRFPGKVAVLRNVVEGDGSDNYRVIYSDLYLQGEAVPPGTSVEARVRVGRASIWLHILEP